jgi:hypothetical protein
MAEKHLLEQGVDFDSGSASARPSNQTMSSALAAIAAVGVTDLDDIAATALNTRPRQVELTQRVPGR